MSKLSTKSYNRKGDCKASIQFDHLLSEKANKPSTAKVSVAAVHRWGMASYTSLRKSHVNGQKDIPSAHVEKAVKRFKQETNPQTSLFEQDDPFGFEPNIELPKESLPVKTEKKSSSSKPNKFFKSGSRRNTALSSQANSPKSDLTMSEASLRQNFYPTVTIANTSLNSSTKNGNSLYERSSRLFESLVQPVRSIHTPLPFIRGDTSNIPSSTFTEQISEKSLFTDSEPTPVEEEQTHLQDVELTNSVISQRRMPNDNVTEPVKQKDINSNPVPYITATSITAEQCSKSESICDQTVDLKFETQSSTPEPMSCSSQSDLPSSMDFSQESSTVLSQETSSSDSQSKKKNISRQKKIFNSSKKNRAVYNHRHWQSFNKPTENEDDEGMQEETEKPSQEKKVCSEFDDFDSEEATPVLVREPKKVESGDVVNTVKCYKPVKQLYTVVRNVKQAYQCHESGETQEFNDDIEYLLEGIQGSNSVGTRCLSILSLATKCMGAAFRVHLRAHGTMPKIFSALQDAPSDPNMSLCTATLLFVLSQDRLTMDIEASTLSLMLQLLETDAESKNSEKDYTIILEDPGLCAMQEKHREKVSQLCEQMQQKGHAKHLKLDNINTGILAMETLLSLTSRKAGEWFKEEMRTLHGLDHIVDTITSCVESLIPEQTQVISKPTESHIDKIRKVDRCLRVLENVTYMNFENQDYLLQYKQCLLINYSLSLMDLCKSHLLENQLNEDDCSPKSVSPVLYCLLSLLKVLLNITFENSRGCSQVGGQKGMMENVLMCILQVPKAIHTDKRFDLLVLSLGLMINLMEHCADNRKLFMEMFSFGSFDTPNDGYEILASEALVEVMLCRLDAAQKSEEQADELLNTQEMKQATEADNAASQAECLEETLMKTLQKAGKHMEHSLIAAYISLMLGFVIQNNQEYADSIRDHVPNGKFDVMIEVLKKFMSFVSLTGAVGNTGVKSIQRIIEVLNSS